MILDKSGNPIQVEKSFSNNYDFNYMFGATNVAGVNVSPESAFKHGAVYSCIRVLAESIGQLPIKLFKYTDTGRVELRHHKLKRVLTQMPNDYMTWQELLEMIVTHLNLDGNFYAYVNKNRQGKIVEIIPIPAPGSVIMQMHKGRVIYKIAQDSALKLPKDTFTSKEMIHIKATSLDGLKGITPIRQAARTVGLSMAAEQHGEEFFNNSATPNGYLTTDSSLSQDAVERLRANWNENFQGLKNSNKTAVFEEGMQYKPIAINHKDAQFLETRNFQKNEICSIFRVPPQMVYGDANVTYANVEQMLLSFHRDTLIPLITRIVNRINCVLPDDIEIDLDDSHLLRGDSKTQADVNDKYFKLGALSINEVRQRMGLDTIEGGDVRAVVTNNITLGNLEELPSLEERLAQPVQPAKEPVVPPNEPTETTSSNNNNEE